MYIFIGMYIFIVHCIQNSRACFFSSFLFHSARRSNSAMVIPKIW